MSESTYVKMPHCWKSHVLAQIMHDYPVGKDLGYCMFQMSGVDSSEDWSGSEEEEGDEEEEDTDVSWETEGEESADTEEEPEEESKKNSP